MARRISSGPGAVSARSAFGRPLTVRGAHRRLRLAVAAAAAVVAGVGVAVVPASVAGAANQAVTNCNDAGPGSLRAAVASAVPGETITFAVVCGVGNPVTLTSGPIDIATDLTIAGIDDNDSVVSGDNLSGVFVVEPGVTATISGLTVEDGNATAGCANACGGGGGGIDNEGTLTVVSSTVQDNTSNENCTSNCLGSGGGIENTGTLTVSFTTITANQSNASCSLNCNGSGGGIENDGVMTVSNSTVSLNGAGNGCGSSCAATGGGIENEAGATATVTASTIEYNSAIIGCGGPCGSSGGGIDNSGFLVVSNSTVAANAAESYCMNNCGSFGGGIANETGAVLTLGNSTLWGNGLVSQCSSGCGTAGGGLFSSGQLTLFATIIANSSGGDCSLASVNDLGYNLADDGTCNLPLASDFNNRPSGLDPDGPLPNGGPTDTIALEPGSMAIDHVAGSLCPPTDQRGFERKPPCDIGAYDTDGLVNPLPVDGSQVHAVIEVETSAAYADDTVHIDSTQLQSSCGGTIVFETLQNGSTLNPTKGVDSITVALDDDGNATVVVDGVECAPGSDVVEADLTVAPYLTALTTLQVEPPTATTPGITAAPTTEVETGNSPKSGNSDVYTVFTVETSPVYAEQPVEISSPQLDGRCGQGWRWEPGTGESIDQASGTETATGILDDDGNATFVFKGASCAAGPSEVVADVEAGTHPTYVSTFTVAAPVVTLSSTLQGNATAHQGAVANKAGKVKKAKGHKHHPKGGGGTATGPSANPPAMTVTASPNPLVETGLPIQISDGCGQGCE